MTKRQIDWEKIELDYRAGIKTLRQIADEHGISHVAINKRAKRDGWVRDLSAKIDKKADELVRKDIDKYDSCGFIYIIYFDDSYGKRFYKIGLSKNFLDRLSSHQTSLPFEIKVACGYFVPNMRYEEKSIAYNI